MSDIVKVTEEEFDAEGNLVRRVITEYGQEKRPTALPYTFGDQGQIVTYPSKYKLWNGPVALREFVDPISYGTRNGVSTQTVQQLADNGED